MRVINIYKITVTIRNNPYPFRNVEQGTQIKMMTVNQKFDKVYSRDRL